MRNARPSSLSCDILHDLSHQDHVGSPNVAEHLDYYQYICRERVGLDTLVM